MKSLISFINEKQNFLIKGHTKDQSDVVDFNLPSGTKWATCNIGANKPEEAGLLFQWGQITGFEHGKKDKLINSEDFKTESTNKTIKDFKEGDKLDKNDDAAYQITKGKFRIPTEDELNELLEHTHREWTELNGIKGIKVFSKHDDSRWIFLPATGCWNGYKNKFTSVNDEYSEGRFWTSTVHYAHQEMLDITAFSADRWGVGNDSKPWNFGNNIRPVLNK